MLAIYENFTNQKCQLYLITVLADISQQDLGQLGRFKLKIANNL